MLSQAYLEYRCPRCGYINAIARETVLDMYKEQSDACQHCQQKLEIIDLYDEEMGEFPFPRNKRLVKAISDLRGSEAGVIAAEAFVQLKRIDK